MKELLDKKILTKDEIREILFQDVWFKKLVDKSKKQLKEKGYNIDGISIVDYKRYTSFKDKEQSLNYLKGLGYDESDLIGIKPLSDIKKVITNTHFEEMKDKEMVYSIEVKTIKVSV